MALNVVTWAQRVLTLTTRQQPQQTINAPSVIPVALNDSQQANYRLEVFRPDFRCEAEAHAATELPREACVVVAGHYIPCRNIADYPEQDFVINPTIMHALH